MSLRNTFFKGALSRNSAATSLRRKNFSVTASALRVNSVGAIEVSAGTMADMISTSCSRFTGLPTFSFFAFQSFTRFR